MYKCPFPECGYTSAYAILNSHAKTHGFKTVKELTKAHGPIQMVRFDPHKYKNNMKLTNNISSGSFNNIESALMRLHKDDRSELKNR